MSNFEELQTPFAEKWMSKSTEEIFTEIEGRTGNIHFALTIFYNSSHDDELKKLIKERAKKLSSLLMVLFVRNLTTAQHKISRPLTKAAFDKIKEAEEI